MRHKVFPRPFLSLTVFLLWAAITNAASIAMLLLGALLAVVSVLGGCRSSSTNVTGPSSRRMGGLIKSNVAGE